MEKSECENNCGGDVDEDVSEAVPVGVPVEPPKVMVLASVDGTILDPRPGIEPAAPFVSPLVGRSDENLMSGESALLLLLVLLGVRLLLLLLLLPVLLLLLLFDPLFVWSEFEPVDGLLYDCC